MRRCANVARRHLCSGAAAPVVHSLARGVLALDVLLAIDARRGREPRAAVLAADVLVTPSSRASTGTGRASIRGLAVAAEGSSGHRLGFPTG